jgi:hypothetical protein
MKIELLLNLWGANELIGFDWRRGWFYPSPRAK